jgi:hypothetical protein
LAGAALSDFYTAIPYLLLQSSARQVWFLRLPGGALFSQKYRETRGQALTLRGENAMMGELRSTSAEQQKLKSFIAHLRRSDIGL